MRRCAGTGRRHRRRRLRRQLRPLGGARLFDYEDDPEVIARKSMAIAARICVYTNENLTVEVLGSE